MKVRELIALLESIENKELEVNIGVAADFGYEIFDGNIVIDEISDETVYLEFNEYNK